jgi:hypothetical protein
MNCGAEMNDDARFCGKCGKPLEANPTSNVETPIAPLVQTNTYVPVQRQQPYHPVNHHQKPPFPVKKALAVAIPVVAVIIILTVWLLYSTSDLQPTNSTPPESGQIGNRDREGDNSADGNNNNDDIISNLPTLVKSPYLGEPITLEEAQQTPGLYIKEGYMFILVEPQWAFLSPLDNYYSYRNMGGTVSAVHGIAHQTISSSTLLPILCDEEFVMPRIHNNVHFVLIGITDIVIYEVVDTGWTIPIGLALWDETRNYPGGWFTSARSELLDYKERSPFVLNYANQAFEEINGIAPTNYVSRMIYTGCYWDFTHGILSASQGEEFTFGLMDGTSWVETTYIADKRFFLLPVDNSIAIQASYEIVETRNGYFEVRFLTPPEGYYAIGHPPGIGSWKGDFDKMIEFVSP